MDSSMIWGRNVLDPDVCTVVGFLFGCIGGKMMVSHDQDLRLSKNCTIMVSCKLWCENRARRVRGAGLLAGLSDIATVPRATNGKRIEGVVGDLSAQIYHCTSR